MSGFEERLTLHREAYREGRRTHDSGYMSETLRSILATKSLRASYELGRLHRAWFGPNVTK